MPLTAGPRRRWGYRLLILGSALTVPAFALTSFALNSTPAPREFNGWAAVFVNSASVSSRTLFTLTSVTQGGAGAHPVVQYEVTACGRKRFDGLLVLVGDARLHEPDTPQAPASPDTTGPLSPVVGLSRLMIAGPDHEPYANATEVQAFRLRLPPVPCQFAYDPEAAAPPFNGPTAGLRGPLEGRTTHNGFAPFGRWPVRQSQSWPLLGQVSVFNLADHGPFRFGPRLPGLWRRPFESYVGVGVGPLLGKAVVDFARPQTIRPDVLLWTSPKPMAASARITNSDNQGKWQTANVAASILLGIGGSILAALVLQAVRPTSSVAPVLPPPPADAPAPRPHRLGRALIGLGNAVIAWRSRARR